MVKAPPSLQQREVMSRVLFFLNICHYRNKNNYKLSTLNENRTILGSINVNVFIQELMFNNSNNIHVKVICLYRSFQIEQKKNSSAYIL